MFSNNDICQRPYDINTSYSQLETATMKRYESTMKRYELAVYLGMEKIGNWSPCHYNDKRHIMYPFYAFSHGFRHDNKWLSIRVTKILLKSHAKHYLKHFDCDCLKQHYKNYKRTGKRPFRGYYKMKELIYLTRRIGLSLRQATEHYHGLSRDGLRLAIYKMKGISLKHLQSVTWYQKQDVLGFFHNIPPFYEGIITQHRQTRSVSRFFSERYYTISIKYGAYHIEKSTNQWLSNGVSFRVCDEHNRRLLHPTIIYPTKHMLSKDTIRPRFAKYYLRHCESDEDSEDQGCMDCGRGGKGDIGCRCPPRRNSYFDDDNWRQRDHDSWESLRDKD